jgi:uncharacterized protein
LLIPIFFGISLIYSSVGFGGGSSYIAILVLAGTSLLLVPPIALLLNMVVTAVALYNFARAGHLSLKFSLPFLSSIPFAFMAGLINLNEKNLSLIFIVALFAASAALLISGAKRIESQPQRFKKIQLSQKQMIAVAIPTGSFLGTIAGLVGIGGGIWLSPLLILTGIQDTKKTAATAALFILANSLSGFLAHSISSHIDFTLLIPLATATFVGGIIGSRLGAFKFDHDKMRTIVGAIVGAAGITLVIKTLLPS